MATRTIRTEGDAILNKKCRLVVDFNDRLHELLDDMVETMTDASGVGLAAPQVGVLRRVVVVLDTTSDEEADHIIELVNPAIIEREGEQTGTEGCLSIPGMWGFVTRPEYVKVRAQDRYGKVFEVEGHGLTARAFCHEIDHLDGHLFSELADKLYSTEELDKMAEENGETEE